MNEKLGINGRSMVLVLCSNDDLDKNNDVQSFSITVLRCHYLINVLCYARNTQACLYITASSSQVAPSSPPPSLSP